jgi:hypothetical protein
MDYLIVLSYLRRLLKHHTRMDAHFSSKHISFQYVTFVGMYTFSDGPHYPLVPYTSCNHAICCCRLIQHFQASDRATIAQLVMSLPMSLTIQVLTLIRARYFLRHLSEIGLAVHLTSHFNVYRTVFPYAAYYLSNNAQNNDARRFIFAPILFHDLLLRNGGNFSFAFKNSHSCMIRVLVINTLRSTHRIIIPLRSPRCCQWVQNS